MATVAPSAQQPLFPHESNSPTVLRMKPPDSCPVRDSSGNSVREINGPASSDADHLHRSPIRRSATTVHGPIR